MDWMSLLYDFLQICIIPMLGILTGYLVSYIKARGQKIAIDTENEVARKYINMLTQTIADCVTATNQTYVDSLKQQGKFDMEAQKTAFKMTYDSVLSILTEDAKEYLTSVYGDLTFYLTQKIEAQVKASK